MPVHLQLKLIIQTAGEEEGTGAGEGRQTFRDGQKAAEDVQKGRPL